MSNTPINTEKNTNKPEKIKRGHGMVWDGLTQTKNKDMFCVKKQSNSRSGTFIEDTSK